MSNWTLFSNHGHVLFCLARHPEARLRDVAADVGITERAVQKIVRDLQDCDMISVTKNGRRNSYRIDSRKSLRHELEQACTLKDLIKVVNRAPGPGRLHPPDMMATRRPLSSKPGSRKSTRQPVSKATAEKTATLPRPVKYTAQEPKPARPETDKTEQTESIEKQQGTLF